MTEFRLPRIERFFEDYAPGSVYGYGPISVEIADVTEFANQFSPSSWKFSDSLAENGSQKPLANEWLVIGLMMRLFVDHFLPEGASIASPGVDEIRWEKAVRAGDALRIRVMVVDARRSASKPDRGIVRAFIETFNQNGELVLSLKSMNLIRSREVVPFSS